MKRNILILMLLLPALLLAACTPEVKQSPAETVELFLDSVKSLDLTTAKTVSDAALQAKIADLEKQLDDPIAQSMLAKLLKVMEYEILSATEEKETALVTLKVQGLTEEALRTLSTELMMAGFSVSDPADTEKLRSAIQSAVDSLDVQALPTTPREAQLTLKKEKNAWVLGEEALTLLTGALLPAGF